MRINIVIPAVLLASALAIGCASGKSNPSIPSSDPQTPLLLNSTNATSSNRYIWGFWDITISENRDSVEITTARVAEMHLNVVRLIEVTPCSTCLRINNIRNVSPNVLDADVTLTHPFPGLLKYTGFDVRGIFISQGNFTFPESGRKIAWGTDVPVVLNADAFTNLFNPTEFPPDQPGPPALRYIPGKYATGGDLSATLNPYQLYGKTAPRCVFLPGESMTRSFRLYAPTGPIHFGYAVDANWVPVDDVTDPVEDFPPDANCPEAYTIAVDIPYGINSSWMSLNPIDILVFDHQGLDTISSVSIEAPDLFDGEISLAYSTWNTDDSWWFSGTIVNETAAVHGTYPLLVRVEDTGTDPNFGRIDGWSVCSAQVKEGWARTWGSYRPDCARGLVLDGSSDVYVTGHFQDTVDFDPGPGIDSHTAPNSERSVFLCKYDTKGIYQWARTWGGVEDCGVAVAIDSTGNIYVTGTFSGDVDFDPGPGEEWHNGYNGSAFLSKFDSSGEFIWARNWGSEGGILGREVAVDSLDNIYITGEYHGHTDFDPGPGEDWHDSNGHVDSFLCKYDSSGKFIWARTWGGTNADLGLEVEIDSHDCAYVLGAFSLTVDFDPGPGEDWHTAVDSEDTYLCKFDSSGEFMWARTWGGAGNLYYGQDIVFDTFGNLYVTGNFMYTVDFDPGPGEDWHTSKGYTDIFLSKFDSLGTLQWARTWGGYSLATETGFAVMISMQGSILVAGNFFGKTDFDPGPDEYWYTGSDTIFLSTFDASGSFLTASAFCEGGNIDGFDGARDSLDRIYITGGFSYITDFEPGLGEDLHTAPRLGSADAFLLKILPDGTW